MPIIKRAGQTGTSNTVQIGTGNAATSAVHIAEVTKQLGGNVAALGKEYLNKSQQALSTAVYDLHMQKATEEFNTLAQERMSKTTDDEGNPNFATLPQDIEKIGNDVMMKRMGTMFDPNAASQFSRDFRNFTSSQSIKAADVSRQQELDYNRAQVKSTVSATINKSLTIDITEVEGPLADMRRSLDSYLQSGAISKQEYDQQLDSTRATVYKAKWSEIIAQDADLAREQLSQEQALGLTEIERRQMLEQAEAKIVDNEKTRKLILKENEKNEANKQKDNYLELETAVLSGKAGESDFIAAFNSGSIDREQMNKGIKFARKEADSKQVKVDIQANLAQDVKEGKPLLDYTPKQIDEFVNTQFNLIEQGHGEPLTITQKAQLASGIDAPVNAVAKPIQHAALFGSDQDAAEAYNAWSFLKDKKNVVVSGMSNDSQATMAMIDSLVTGSSLPVEQAVQAVRKIQETRTPEKIQEISENYKNEVDKDDMFDLANDIAGEGFLLFGKEDLQAGTSDILYNTMRNAYVATNGDIKAARTLVDTWTKDVLGTTNVGGSEKIMFLAPEKMFPALTSEQLDSLMRDEMGIDADAEVVIESDRSSRKVPGTISWSISVLDEDGIPTPVGRWALDNETAYTYLTTQTEAIDIEALKEDKKLQTKVDKSTQEATDIMLKNIQRF